MAIALDDMVKQVKDLPALSAVVAEVLASIDQEDIDVQVLGGKIALDQALAAKTLRLANSSFYGMPSKVTTIHQAISVLGFHSIRTLVTACSVTGAFPGRSQGGLDFQAFWRHSVATAICAKSMAKAFRCSPEVGFTAGLLHDIGRLVLATRYPDQYIAVMNHRREQDCLPWEAEQAVLGLDHTAVGRQLAAHWKFPDAICDAVAGHHAEQQSMQAPLTLLVHSADIMAHALDLADVEDDLVPPVSETVWKALPLAGAEGDKLLRDTESTFKELSQILVH